MYCFMAPWLCSSYYPLFGQPFPGLNQVCLSFSNLFSWKKICFQKWENFKPSKDILYYYISIFKEPIFVILEKKKEPHDVRNFDYTARSWTGKSPKQFLIDWVRKNLPKSPNPSFEKVAVGRYWKCRYVFG